MRVIYVDTLFAINFIVNYIVLLATAKVSGFAESRRRIALGAAIGGIYAVLAVVPGGFLTSPWIKIAVGALLVLVVFGSRRRLLRTGLIFFAISAAFGGTVLAVSMLTGDVLSSGVYLPVPFKVLALAFCVCYIVLKLVFTRLGKTAGQGAVLPVRLAHKGKSCTLNALVDTGHTLSDPLTGGDVLVVERDAILPLFSQEVRLAMENGAALDPVAFLEREPEVAAFGFYLIPYTAVGVGHALLLAFRPEGVWIGKTRQKRMAVALSPTRVSDGGPYTALISGGAVA